MGILEMILGSMDLESVIKERRGRGRKPLRPARLYLKALVLKEMDKLSLRYAESLSSMHFGERIPRSTMSYWELNYGFLVEEVLKILFGVLCPLEYDYTVLGSTKFTDWHKATHEAFLSVRVRAGEALFPVYGDLMTSEAEFVEGIPSGSGFALADESFDARPVLNELASKGYIPIVKPRRLWSQDQR
jgi:hypothetical protein